MFRSVNAINSSELRICVAPCCGNFHCLPCLKDLYGKISWHQILDLDDPGNEMFGHTKKCHGKICKVYGVSDDWKNPWNQDGKDGDDDPNNSDNLLIKWLTCCQRQPQVVQGRKMYATRLPIWSTMQV